MKLPKREKLKPVERCNPQQKEPSDSNKNDNNFEIPKNNEKEPENRVEAIYKIRDNRDLSYQYILSKRYLWRRNRSNEILINVITNKIDPKSITNIEKLMQKIKVASKNIALDCLLTQKLIKCHLSTCIKQMNLSIKHYLRVKSNLTFLVSIKNVDPNRWMEMTRNIRYTQEELSFIRSLVKSGFVELALMGDWHELIGEYQKSDKFKFFKMHEEHLFKLKLVRRETEDVKINNNSLLDLRSNLSMFSRLDDLGNFEVTRENRSRSRSRLNSFSDSHSLKGQFSGLDQFDLF